MKEMGLDETKLRKWDDIESNEAFKEFMYSNGSRFNPEFLERHKRKIKAAKVLGYAAIAGVIIFVLIDPKHGAITKAIDKLRDKRSCKCDQLRLIEGGDAGKQALRDRQEQENIPEIKRWGDTAWIVQNEGGTLIDNVVNSCENEFCDGEWGAENVTFQKIDASLEGGYVGVVRVNPDDVMRKRTSGDAILDLLTPQNIFIVLVVFFILIFAMRQRVYKGIATVKDGVSRVAGGAL